MQWVIRGCFRGTTVAKGRMEMKAKFTAITSIVLILAVIATVVAFSFAWFASSTSVSTDSASISAVEVGDVFVSSGTDVNFSYMGQTGTSLSSAQEDFAYKAIRTVSVQFNPKSTIRSNVITAKFSRIALTQRVADENGDLAPVVTTSDEDATIFENFTWRLYHVEVGTGAEILTNYYPDWYFGEHDGNWRDGAGEIVTNTTFTKYYPCDYYSETVLGETSTYDDDIIRTGASASEGEDADMLEIDTSGSTTLTFVIEITFQSPRNWKIVEDYLAGTPVPDGTEIQDFAYSGYEYMNSQFDFWFSIGMIEKPLGVL